VDDGPGYRVLKQVETQERGAGVFRQVEFLDVDRVHGDVVAVRAVPGGRRRTDIAALTGVVDQGQRATRQIAPLPGTVGQLGDRGGQVGYRPVPEPGQRR